MLRGLNPLLGPDLLQTLCAMGHGDEIGIVDANFPATTMGQRVHRLDGIDAVTVADAILSVLPLDTFVDHAAFVMQMVDKPDEDAPIFGLFQEAIDRSAKGFEIGKLERFAFYERTRACFAVVATGERRLYGNLILTKGVIAPPT